MRRIFIPILWIVFRRADVRFHFSREPSLRAAFRQWMSGLKPDKIPGKDPVIVSHIEQIKRDLAAPRNRMNLIEAGYDRAEISLTWHPGVFYFHSQLTIRGFRPKIDLTLFELKPSNEGS